jgi:hypothetical protein
VAASNASVARTTSSVSSLLVSRIWSTIRVSRSDCSTIIASSCLRVSSSSAS